MKRFLYLFLALWVLASCHDEDAPRLSEKTVIVYIAGDNSLSDFSHININQMEKGLLDNGHKLIVYVDTRKETPKLLRIQKDDTEEIKSVTVKEYGEHNSADPKILKQVLNDAKKLYPSKSYGLVLWSHATAWLPPKGATTYSFAEDKGKEIDIRELPAAIPDGFDYIIFDACWMASVEVLYELKDKVPYILSSPIEVLGEGLPYDKVVPLFFKNTDTEKRLTAIAETFYNHYNEKEGDYQTAATTLVKTSELTGLATATKALLLPNPLQKWKYNYDKIQKLDSFGYTTIMFDFLDFLEKNYDNSKLGTIKEQLKKTVIYEKHTKNYLGVPLKNLCGLSCYIPTKDNSLNKYYKTLSWTEASGFYVLLEQ